MRGLTETPCDVAVQQDPEAGRPHPSRPPDCEGTRDFAITLGLGSPWNWVLFAQHVGKEVAEVVCKCDAECSPGSVSEAEFVVDVPAFPYPAHVLPPKACGYVCGFSKLFQCASLALNANDVDVSFGYGECGVHPSPRSGLHGDEEAARGACPLSVL